MATGKSSYFDIDSNKSGFKVRVNWSETYDASTNSSVVTIDSIQFKSTDYSGVTYYPDGVVKINDEIVITMDSIYGDHNCVTWSTNTWSTIKKSGGATATASATVVHDADGTKTISIELAGHRSSRFYFYSAGDSGEQQGGAPWSASGSGEIELTSIQTYTLSVTAGTGSTITVNRTSSGYSEAATGTIAAGTRLYYGDKLKISFAAKTNYGLLTTTVNNVSFTSGNTHTVSGNVSVKATAQVLASKVGAADANIGSTSTITVTKYNSGYCHSLQYSFGEISGYITSSGGVQSSEVKFEETSVAFSVPNSFYAQIPNSKTGVCTITCRTYSSSSSTTVLGNATTCTFTVTAAKNNCSPVVTATVEDTNAVTRALTGDPSVLIRYRSTANCTITATSRQESTIESISIAGTAVTGSTSGDNTTGSASFPSVDKTSFVFSATDSREYTTTKTVKPTVVAYVVLTCNPTVSRPTPTGSAIALQVSGNVFRGSFGAYSNTLRVQYRYRESGGSYGEWKTIDSSHIIYGTSNYRTNGVIALDDEYDYQKSYDFQVRALDGTEDYVLSTDSKTVNVQRGIPVFDWGRDDFNVNGDLRMSNVSILDIFYPVGSVYMSTNSALPSALSVGGMTWESMSQISGMYCWKRIT